MYVQHAFTSNARNREEVGREVSQEAEALNTHEDYIMDTAVYYYYVLPP